VSVDAARAAADAARCVTGYGAAASGCGGWSTAPGVYGIVRRPVAGKTGTTDGNRSEWFVGFTPDLAAASFMADPDNPFHTVGGSNTSKPIEVVSHTLRDSLKDEPVANFTPPDGELIGKRPAPVPAPKGTSPPPSPHDQHPPAAPDVPAPLASPAGLAVPEPPPAEPPTLPVIPVL
jgi:membrane peptidoglycan carboxypeptidase